MKAAAVTALFGVAFYASVASLLIAASLVLSAVAVGVWLQNRANLAELDRILKEKAAKGRAVLDESGA